MIWVDENPEGPEGSLPWLVLERDEGALTLAPVLRAGRQPQVRFRVGQKLTARFWREGDTEYRFLTSVVGKSHSPHSVTVEHATLERMQHRDFYRIDVNFPADFLVIPFRDELAGGGQDAHIDAAINLLDQSVTETIRVAPSVAADEAPTDAGTPGAGTASPAPTASAAEWSTSAAGDWPSTSR